MSRACASTPSASSSPATRSSCSPLVEVRPPPSPQAARNLRRSPQIHGWMEASRAPRGELALVPHSHQVSLFCCCAGCAPSWRGCV
jgi:hypothetical protein